MAARKRPRIGVVTSMASRLGGGVYEAVLASCEMLQGMNLDPIVFALHDRHSDADRERLGKTELVTSPVTGPAMVGFAPDMAAAMLRADLDLVHLHGIWMYPSGAVARWAKQTGRPTIISPHGMLDPWILGRGRLKKAVARALFERDSWRRATFFHALTQAEAADIRRATGREDIVTIPNVVGLAEGAYARTPTVVYLGRIHPKKNIDGLVQGWREAADTLRPIGAKLRIGGYGSAADVAALEAQIAAGPNDDIEFLGPVFGARKSELLGAARFSVLPSHSEGLPMAILESWAMGTPTLMSEHCHLPEGFAAGCALDCGTDVAQIAATLRQAFRLPETDWQRMSDGARLITQERFSPERVAQRWGETYSAMLSGVRPA